MVGRPRKVSDTGIAEIRAWHEARTALATPREMRERHRICSSQLSLICRGLQYKAKRGGNAP